MKYPLYYPSARYIERTLVNIGIDLFKGTCLDSDKICGLLTTGGTESILFAILSYRNRALSKGIEEPEL